MLASGTKLGSYEVVVQIGAGGMGEVYQAHDTKLGRDVAIKVLPAAFVNDPERLSRFQREARVLAALNHPNIATIHGLEQSQGIHFLIMELVAGETLGQRVKAGAVPVEEAMKISVQMADALEAAHEKGIVHRDLKPANVKVTPEGRVKVLDFGLAKAFAGDETNEDIGNSPTVSRLATMQGVILGTAAYMSPEQARGKAVDKRTDIWAFGCVLYELLTGVQAFHGEATADILAAVVTKEPDWNRLAANTPLQACELVRRCLQKDARRRLRDIGDARIEIDEAIATPATIGPTSAVAIPQRARWVRATLWGIMPLLLVVVAIGLLLNLRRSPASPIYRQMTFRRGTIRAARFAPDGNTIVYSAAYEGGGFQIYWMRSESVESTPLPFLNARFHSVSSSGELAIGLRRGGTITLAEVPLAGGAPREILDGFADADWAPDGENLAVARDLGDRVRIEFPVGHVLYDTGPGVGVRELRFSPRGDLLAFIETGPVGESICVLDHAGKRRILSPNWETIRGLAWNPMTGEIWFGARGANVRSEGLILHAVSLSGKERVVARVPGLLIVDDIARDGRVLLTHAEWRTSMICLPPGSAKEVDLSWFDFSRGADLSNDGKSILFDEGGIAGGAKGGVYLRGTDGSPAVHLGEGEALGLSPDGQWALSRPSDSAEQLLLLPVRAGQSRVLKAGGMEYQSAEWLPDGKRILFSGAPHGNPARLYVQEIEGGNFHPLAPEGVDLGPVSPDGNYLIGRGPGPGVFLYPVSGGPSRAVMGVEPDDQLVRWDADGKRVFLTRAEGPAVSLSIYRLDLTSGQRELWKKIGPADPTGLRSIDITDVHLTPDGTVYSYSYMRDLSNLYVVEGLK